MRDRVRRLLEIRGDAREIDAVLAEEHEAWLVGTVEQVAERLERYRAAGVARVVLQHLDHRDEGTVALIGRRLAPAVSQ